MKVSSNKHLHAKILTLEPKHLHNNIKGKLRSTI